MQARQDRRSPVPTVLLLALTLPAFLNAQAAPARPLWGNLELGSFEVGFQVLYRLDRSRVWRPTSDSLYGGEFARPVRISVWYPSPRRAGTRRMRFRDYIHLPAPNPYFAVLNRLLEERDTTSFREMFAPAQSQYPELLGLEVAARRNAPPAAGMFPLVMYSQGWNSSHQHDNVVLAEYLASHGYVVAAIPQVGETIHDLTLQINPVDLEVQMRDVEFALGIVQGLPFVDRRNPSLMGWSMGGVVSLWISGRNPVVRAVVGLDASFRAKNFVSLTMGSPYFDIRRLRAPVLALQAGNAKYVGGQDDRVVDSLRFAERFVGRVANITHGDFSDFAMIAKLYPVDIVDRTADEASRGHETVCQVVRAFLDRTVKGDRRAFGSSAFDGLTLIHREPATVPSEEHFAAMVPREGLAPTVARLRQLQAAHPGLAIIRYPVMNRLGYRMLRAGRSDAALGAFLLNVEAYPGSADGFDSLADGYLAKGDSASARRAYERVLELLPADSTLDTRAREDLRERALERVRTLRRSP